MFEILPGTERCPLEGAEGSPCLTSALFNQPWAPSTASRSPSPFRGGFAALLLMATPALAQEMDHSKMEHGQSQMDQVAESDFVHGHEMEQSIEGSGTSRLPVGISIMKGLGRHSGLHFSPGGNWMLMLHGYATSVYTDQTGPRGDDKFYVQSMAMLSAEKDTGWGRVKFNTMMSLEPLMKHNGYPNLFATGETAQGQPLIDRQHPHDLFMELSARVDVNVANNTRVFLYGGPVGEPALGPSAFMHRASAKYNPEAPITHHWFDSTHITYGVITAGIATPTLQFEASAFRGREPDERRFNIETPKLDSWSVRATWNPSPKWAAQISYGQLKEPEELEPGDNEHRTTASVHYANGNGLSAMAAFSSKNKNPGRTLTAFVGEANWDISDHHTLFGRVENVRNDALFPDALNPLHDQTFRMTEFQAGYAYRLPLAGPVNLALGGSLSAFAKLSLGH